MMKKLLMDFDLILAKSLLLIVRSIVLENSPYMYVRNIRGVTSTSEYSNGFPESPKKVAGLESGRRAQCQMAKYFRALYNMFFNTMKQSTNVILQFYVLLQIYWYVTQDLQID